MRAIEINSRTDKTGYLKIEYRLDQKDSNVRVLILMDEMTDENDEKLWLKSISKNPAFDFLKDAGEDIYSLTDGEPVND